MLTRGAMKKELAKASTEPQQPAAAVEIEAETGHTSAQSQMKARRSKLIRDAEKEKAKVRLELIEKTLEADLAALDVVSSQQSNGTHRSVESPDPVQEIENWIDNNRQVNQELPPAHDVAEAHDANPFHAMPLQPQHRTSTGTDIDKLAAALTTAIQTSVNVIHSEHNQQLLSRLATSKDLPPYSGDPIEWLHFKESYYETTRLCKFSDAENIHRLRKCLQGEAKDAVAWLLIGKTNPSSIMETLELRFGQPETVITKIVTQIKRLSPLPLSYHTDIVNFATKIKNFAVIAQSIKQSDYLRSPELVNTVLSKLPSSLINRWSDYIFDRVQSDKSRFENLSDFLMTEAVKVVSSGVSHIHSHPDIYKKKPEDRRIQPHRVFLTAGDDSCKFCKKGVHSLPDCKYFKRAMRRNRWRFVRMNKLCSQCLLSTHDVSDCPSDVCDVDNCGLKHHRLLHWYTKNVKSQLTTTPATNENVNTNACSENGESSEAVTNISMAQRRTILLKVVPVTVNGPKGHVKTFALLDDGATVSLISSKIAHAAGLHGNSETLRVRSAWCSGQLVCQSETVNFTVSSTNNDTFKIRARKIDSLDLPVQKLSNVAVDRYKHIRKFQDCLLLEDVKPELLIGQDYYYLLAPMDTISEGMHRPYLTRTLLGWCVHGIVYNTRSNSKHAISTESVNHVSTSMPHDIDSPAADVLTELSELIRHSFSLESIGIALKPRQNKEEALAVQILDDTSKLVGGHWEVGLPWRSDAALPDSFPNAYKRFRIVEGKMRNNEEYALRYQDRINHLLLNDYAREVDQASTAPQRLWYLPHFGVDNPYKKKLRVVFDAAAKSGGYSLNDFLLQGPDLLQSLLGIMFRFREGRVAIAGDIKDMFLRVKIREADRDVFRFLWREKPNQPLKKFVMTSLVFGANCSPFIAQFIKNKNALRFQSQMPEAVTAIIKSHYMDDCIHSMNDVDMCAKLVKDISYIHRQGGFHIVNWMSNIPEILDGMPKEDLSDNAIKFKLGGHNLSERTLGLLWYPLADSLGFDLSLKRISNDLLTGQTRPTKRELFKIVMSIFDLYGLLAPFTIRARILIQNTWKTDIKWDHKILEAQFDEFRKWMVELNDIRALRIPRCYFPPEYKLEEARVELHLFCDASPSAYAAVAYWRVISKSTHDQPPLTNVSFIASKSRVAPVRPVTIPRLELQGALLASRLAAVIQEEHSIVPAERFFWTDSTIVLHWLRNESRNYKMFIANRLGEIGSLTKIKEWRYVPSHLNIADIATKKNSCKLHVDCEWFRGPQFLQSATNFDWPGEPEKENKINGEDLEAIHIIQDSIVDLPVPDPLRFSSWTRLLRSTATVLLFIGRCRKLQNSNKITCELLSRAEALLVRHSQLESFSSEYKALKESNGVIDRASRLRSLNPFIDDSGVMRVGGRIESVRDVRCHVKHPVILDGKSHISRLIVMHFHRNAAHGCNETVVNELRQLYWIVKIRPTVRSVTRKCLLCRIRRVQPKPPLMGDLPEARMLHHHRPFTATGVDLFGPLEITVGRRQQKVYAVLFTCLTVRAVHIELVQSLTADALIMALRRMAARRGWPKKLYSDNGTNLRGADVELRRSFGMCQNELQSGTTSLGVEWIFISPVSPHMGGAWERLIRSVKTSLRAVLSERAPREEVLLTLLAEVESLVNSRPLTHVTVDPDYPEALTPNHFLLGSSSSLPTPGAFDDDDLCLRRQWRIAQRLTDLFWSRWMKEVLPAMLPRSKWQRDETPLKIGDLVFVVDPSSPRNCWPRGVIIQLYPGKDGRIRVVDVKTKTGILKRPSTRIAVLPIEEAECRQRENGTGAEC